jgi:hypothetical protein
VTAGGGKLGVVSLEKVHFTLNLLPCVWLESRSSGVEPSLVLGTLQPFSCLVAKVELEWLQPFFFVGGTKYGMDGSFNTVNGSHMS